MKKISITDFFDPYNVEHLKAYDHLQKTERHIEQVKEGNVYALKDLYGQIR